ncbi:hypothetical protein [Moraxella phage Mcat29]|nr:hypothetical protein [Moraxella phage Mcat29]
MDIIIHLTKKLELFLPPHRWFFYYPEFTTLTAVFCLYANYYNM